MVWHRIIRASNQFLPVSSASRSRALAIPGADAPNTFGSSAFAGWYNGHPDHSGLAVDLSGKTAVVIGIGNVALDIARMLVLSI